MPAHRFHSVAPQVEVADLLTCPLARGGRGATAGLLVNAPASRPVARLEHGQELVHADRILSDEIGQCVDAEPEANRVGVELSYGDEARRPRRVAGLLEEAAAHLAMPARSRDASASRDQDAIRSKDAQQLLHR